MVMLISLTGHADPLCVVGYQVKINCLEDFYFDILPQKFGNMEQLFSPYQ